uniref:Uncharacterized protein n=1 Tax=Physcomitrium patens TaxID=3218 RepID=A0A2K1JIL8_PHYPA|nr:hypothetical protein PHYPA_018804 [Physcomitrium patens]
MFVLHLLNSVSTANQCSPVTAPQKVLCQTCGTSILSFTERINSCPGVCSASTLD